MNILNIEDEIYLRNSEPYIYTNKEKWFICHFTSLEKAMLVKPEGYNVSLYVTTRQIPFSGF